MKYLAKVWKNNRSVILFIVLMSVFRSAVADWYEVPTGSMKPTILEGDRILTNKMAYDIRLPFTPISLFKMGDPQTGDIIVFNSKIAQNRLIKRVIGVPGDTISMIDNVLKVNGKNLEYQNVNVSKNTVDKVENLLGHKHLVRVSTPASSQASFNEITIPQGYYLAMGDNRDNSADSRVIGLVPRAELLGKANKVIVSLNYNDYYLPRENRYLQPLE
jgi:signal peptidase I